MIPGWERDIRHAERNTACIHVLGLLFSDAAETPASEVRRYDCLEIPDQQLLDEMREAGQFVVLAHPHWSRMTPSDVLALTGFHAIEVFNTGCERLMHAGRADLHWDLLLQEGRRVWGVACDDTHGKTAKKRPLRWLGHGADGGTFPRGDPVCHEGRNLLFFAGTDPFRIGASKTTRSISSAAPARRSM